MLPLDFGGLAAVQILVRQHTATGSASLNSRNNTRAHLEKRHDVRHKLVPKQLLHGRRKVQCSTMESGRKRARTRTNSLTMVTMSSGNWSDLYICAQEHASVDSSKVG